MRRPDGSTFIVESAAPDELAGASTCREAVDLMVDTIVCACAEVKAGKDDGVPSVQEGDIVRFVFSYLFPPPSSLTFGADNPAWPRRRK